MNSSKGQSKPYAVKAVLAASASLFSLAAIILVVSLISVSYLQISQSWRGQVEKATENFSRTVSLNLWHFDFRGVEQSAISMAELWNLDRIKVVDQFNRIIVDTNSEGEFGPPFSIHPVIGANNKEIGKVSYWVGQPTNLLTDIITQTLVLLTIALSILALMYWRLKAALQKYIGDPLRRLDKAILESRLPSTQTQPTFEYQEFDNIIVTFGNLLDQVSANEMENAELVTRGDNVITSFYNLMAETDQAFRVETELGAVFVEQSNSSFGAANLETILKMFRSGTATRKSIGELNLRVNQWVPKRGDDELLEVTTTSGDILALHYRVLPNAFQAITAQNVSSLRRTETVLDSILSQADIGVAVFSTTGELAMEYAVQLNRLGSILPDELNYESISNAIISASVRDLPNSVDGSNVFYCELDEDVIEFVMFELPGGFNCIIHKNITVQKKSEDAMIEAGKMRAIGQLTSGVAHDFNNMLSVILASLETFVKKNDLKNDALLATAISSATHGSSVTRQLLALVSMRESEQSIVNVGQSLKENLGMLETPLDAGVVLQLKINSNACVLLDEQIFMSSILNAVLNSNDAMDSAGKIQIIVNEEPIGIDGEGPMLRVTIADNGSGIPKESLAQVLDPFFTTKPVGEGAGLGLAMLKTFVDQSNGSVDIESSKTGTKVHIRFPVLAADSTDPNTEAEDVGKSSPVQKRVVLVDDNKTLLDLYKTALVDSGHVVFSFEDPLEAVKKVRSFEQINVLLVDLRMPNLSGIEVAKEFVTQMPKIKVALMSGNVLAKDFEELQSSPIEQVLQKPISLTELVKFVEG